MNKRYQVFVSSTYADLQEERQHVIQTIMEMDCIPSGMELFPALDEQQWEFIKKVIDDCDYYLLIIGGRYGSLAAEGISYTEKEYDYAIERGIKVIALLHSDPDSIPVSKSDTSPELRERLAAFRHKVAQNRLVRTWNKTEDLPRLVALSLGRTIREFPAVGWVRADAATDNVALTTPPAKSNRVNECADKRLHEVAKKQAEFIQYLLVVESVKMTRHHLLGESPFVEFEISVKNYSVFKLSVGEFSGSAKYAYHLLDTPAIMRSNLMKNIDYLWTRSCTIKQPLKPEDVKHILNSQAWFDFRELDLKIVGGEGCEDIVEPQNLRLPEHVNVSNLREDYPKLKAEFKRAVVALQNKGDDPWTEPLASVVSLQVVLTNPRLHRVNIQAFKLLTTIQTQRFTPAVEGETIEIEILDKGAPFGQSLPNLNRPPIGVENGQPVEGWVQFVVQGYRPDQLLNPHQTLVVVDVSGEEHYLGCPMLERL
jgi:hypothetical protein